MHIPTVVWSLRGPGSDRQAYVRTTDLDGISIVGPGPLLPEPTEIVLSRADARLLARRIGQCLRDTGPRGKYGRSGKITRPARNEPATD